ncbi:hypothetical protein DK37_13775 [Halomonas sp. SUBG004]|nr:hypothetical protein DK37_13775 [Halomonas sp. SUBG004]
MAPAFWGNAIFGEELATLGVCIEEHAVRAEFALFISGMVTRIASFFNVVERLSSRRGRIQAREFLGKSTLRQDSSTKRQGGEAKHAVTHELTTALISMVSPYRHGLTFLLR